MLVPRKANHGPRPSVRAFRPKRTLTDGAGGFLPGVPMDRLDRESQSVGQCLSRKRRVKKRWTCSMASARAAAFRPTFAPWMKQLLQYSSI
jgi:hypothetical protein